MIVWFQIEQKRYTINNVTEQFAKGESTPLEGLYSFSTRAVYGHLPVFLKRIYCILKHVRNDGKGCYSSSSSRSAPPFDIELVLRSQVTRKMTIKNLCTFYVWSFSDKHSPARAQYIVYEESLQATERAERYFIKTAFVKKKNLHSLIKTTEKATWDFLRTTPLFCDGIAI